MKKLVTLVLFLSLVQWTYSASKLLPDRCHFISVTTQVGYSTLLSSVDAVKSAPGVAPAIGLGYHLYADHLIMNVGVQGEFGYRTNKIGDSDLKLPMIDTEGEKFTMHARVTDCKDICQSLNLNIPLLFGCEYGRVYFMAGPMVGLNLWGRTSSRSAVNTSAIYDRFISEFSDMPNHQLYAGEPISSEPYDLSWNLNVAAHIEIGARVSKYYGEKGADIPSLRHRVYLSVFAEYGFLNIHKDKSVGSAMSYVETDEGLKFYVIPAMLSEQMLGAKVNPLTVGVKCTWLMEMPHRAIRFRDGVMSRRVR